MPVSGLHEPLAPRPLLHGSHWSTAIWLPISRCKGTTATRCCRHCCANAISIAPRFLAGEPGLEADSHGKHVLPNQLQGLLLHTRGWLGRPNGSPKPHAMARTNAPRPVLPGLVSNCRLISWFVEGRQANPAIQARDGPRRAARCRLVEGICAADGESRMVVEPEERPGQTPSATKCARCISPCEKALLGHSKRGRAGTTFDDTSSLNPQGICLPLRCHSVASRPRRGTSSASVQKRVLVECGDDMQRSWGIRKGLSMGYQYVKDFR